MNDWERLHRQAERYKQSYPPGTRVWLIRPKKMTWHFGEQLEVFGQPLIFFAFSQLFSHSI